MINAIAGTTQAPVRLGTAAPTDMARPLFTVFMTELLKHSGVERALSGGTTGGPDLAFLATEALVSNMSDTRHPLYLHWTRALGGD